MTGADYATRLRRAQRLTELDAIVAEAFSANAWDDSLEPLRLEAEQRLAALAERAERAGQAEEQAAWEAEAAERTRVESTPPKPDRVIAWPLELPPRRPEDPPCTHPHVIIGRAYITSEHGFKLAIHSWELRVRVNGGDWSEPADSDNPDSSWAIPGDWSQIRSGKIWPADLSGAGAVEVQCRGVCKTEADPDLWTRGPWSDPRALGSYLPYEGPEKALPLVGQLPFQGWRGLRDDHMQCEPVDPAADPEYRLVPFPGAPAAPAPATAPAPAPAPAPALPAGATILDAAIAAARESRAEEDEGADDLQQVLEEVTAARKGAKRGIAAARAARAAADELRKQAGDAEKLAAEAEAQAGPQRQVLRDKAGRLLELLKADEDFPGIS